jgi:uncharacterized protein (TIGR03000 family)
MGLRLARWSLLLLAGLWLLQGLAQAETEAKPVTLLIKLPADAELYINGDKTKQTGTERTFESPPVPVDKTKKYHYQIKAVWKENGKEVVREQRFDVKPGQVNELDLLAGPKAKLTVKAPESIDVQAGGEAKIPLKFTTENIKGGITTTTHGAPPKSRVTEGTLIPGAKEGSVEVQVDKGTKAGPYDLVVRASADGAQAEATVKLNVKAAAAPAGKLKVEVPANVAVEAGAKKPLTIKVTRENVKGPVKVTFTGLPENIRLPELNLPEDAGEINVDLAPPKDAKPGTSDVTVKAQGGGATAEGKFKLDVKPSKDEKKDKDKDTKDKDKPKDKDTKDK